MRLSLFGRAVQRNGGDYDAVKLYGGAKPGDATFADIVAVDGEIAAALEARRSRSRTNKGISAADRHRCS
jgi:hypothetical protein